MKPLDISALFRTLADHHLDYLVIGGVATQVHGHRRTTRDLDILPAPDAANFDRLLAALADLDTRLRDDPQLPPPSDAEQLRTAAIVPPLMTRHGELHVINAPAGAGDYRAMRERALVVELDGVEIAIAGVDDLIRMKKASGRESDLADIAVLANRPGA